MKNKTTKSEKTGDILDRINTVQDLLDERGKKMEDVCNPKDKLHHVALDLLEYGIEVINEGFEADYDNPNQKKWEPIFVWGPSGFAFAFAVCNFTNTCSISGSRLSYASREKCERFCRKPEILKLYNQLLTKTKK